MKKTFKKLVKSYRECRENEDNPNELYDSINKIVVIICFISVKYLKTKIKNN